MNLKSDAERATLITVIVNHGLGSRIVRTAKAYGITGGTVTLGKGTVSNRILDFLGLCDIRKEIIYLAAEEETANRALDAMNKEFRFDKPNHGIAFTTSISRIVGTRSVTCEEEDEERGGKKVMYHIITTIVDKGRGEEVITAATAAGSTGGTILNGRGSGIHETSKVFSMEIEPEKEIVMILSEAEKSEVIVASIRADLRIDEPANGIIFVQDVLETYGIYK